MVETNIHYPTDSSLLGDGLRVLTRVMKRVTEGAGEVGTKLRDRSRSVKLRAVEIARVSRSKSEQGQQRKDLYGKILDSSGRVAHQAQQFANEIASGVKRSADVKKQAALEGMKKELEKCIDTLSFGLVLARLHKGSRIVIEQTRVNDEVWLPQHVAVKVDARVALLKEFNIEHDVTYRDYKKFRADKKVVPMGEVAEPRSGLAAGFSAGLDALDSTLAGRQSLRPEAAHARVVLSASAGPARAARTRPLRSSRTGCHRP